MNKILLILAIIIQISFFISAVWTNWYDYFFFGNSLHYCCRGLDFYQIPNGVYAFFHGGDLTGKIPLNTPPYSFPFYSNWNVYHPLSTLLMGSFFLLFKPEFSFYLFITIRMLLNFALATYLYYNFKTNKYIYPALFLMLINFNQYNEIKIAQYQFLANAFIMLLLISLVKKQDNFKTALFYFATLLIKPISLLWLPVLIIKNKVRTSLYGLALFLACTLFFQLTGIGNYYTQKLLSHFIHPDNLLNYELMSLGAFLRYSFGVTQTHLMVLKLIFMAVVVFLSFSKKVELIKLIYLLALYFLFFYDLVYQYHFTILIPILTIGLLTCKNFQTSLAKLLLVIISLPNLFFILRFLQIGVLDSSLYGTNPTALGWQIVSLGQIIPLFLLAIVIFKPSKYKPALN